MGKKKEKKRDIVKHRPLCKCGKIGERDIIYDAYYCPTCRVWLEDICKDTKCTYCVNRPDLPY